MVLLGFKDCCCIKYIPLQILLGPSTNWLVRWRTCSTRSANKTLCPFFLKATYYGSNTFPVIWDVVLGLWCCHTHPNFEMSLYFLLLLFWVRYAFQVLPTVNNRASQFRRILLHRKQVHLHITPHFPIPLQSEQRYDFVAQRWAEMSLLIVEVPETSDVVIMIHNVIRGSHSFWPWYWILYYIDSYLVYN